MRNNTSGIERAALKMTLLCFAVALMHLSVLATHVHAYECNAPSPSYSGDETPFDEMEIRDLTRTEQDALVKLFKSMPGQWRGTGDDYECRGPKEAIEKTRQSYTVSAKVTTDYFGNMRIETELKSRQKRTNHSEVVEFYLKDRKLRIDTDNSAGDVELLDVSRQGFKFLKRGHIAGGWASTSSTKREMFVTLSAGTGAFSIETLIYAQGRFLARKIRQFKK